MEHRGPAEGGSAGAPPARPAPRPAALSAWPLAPPAPEGADRPPARFVAFDCETTGLDSERDALIQLAAVRVDPDGVQEWSTLVDPGRPVPLSVQRLTGITPARLAGAPPPAAALARFLAFAGPLPLVAHNAAFDREVLSRALRREGLPLPPGPVFDTLELSRLLDPQAPSHRLEDLAARRGLSGGRAHDALEDARATAALARALFGELAALPPALLATLAHLLRHAPGPLAAMLRGLGRGAGAPRALWRSLPPVGEERRREPEGEPPPVDALRALLEPDSPLGAALGGLEPRPGQVRMLEAVARAFASGRHLVVEAGTGTGKSLAYLIPSLAWARARARRVVVATHTVNLQEQLVEKDLPAIARSGRLPASVALLKGRAQYACLKLWEEQLGQEADPADGPFLARFATWLAVTETGERSELVASAEDEERFAALSADAVACTGRHCPHYEACFLFRARRRAEAADVVVVNHALLFSDVRREGSVLPEYECLVCDEAHHLEDQASQHLGRTVGERGLERFFHLLDHGGGAGRRPGGALATLGAALGSPGWLPTGGPGRAERAARRLAEALQALGACREGAAGCFGALRAWALAHAARGSRDRWTVRLPAREHAGSRAPAGSGEAGPTPPEGGLARTGGVPGAAATAARSDRRDSPGDVAADPLWVPVQAEGERLIAGLRALAKALTGCAEAMDDGSPEAEADAARIAELGALAARAGELGDDLALCLEGQEGWVAWVEVAAGRGGQPGAAVLHACPVDPADLLRERLFAPRRSVVLTSATLSVRGSCAFLRSRLGLAQGAEAERTDELVLGSPFDYRRQVLLALPNDLPRPDTDRAEAHAQAVAPFLADLLRASRGHALVLFNATRLMVAVRAQLKRVLEGEGIACLAQGLDGSRSALTRTLRRNEDTVVLGVSSFWEGVDVRGDALRLLVIAQLPFAAPGVPLHEARQERVRARGGRPFTELQLPEAVLRFKQGFGRLIRSAGDRGAVVVLDPRLVTANYGPLFVESLPGPEVLVAPAAAVLQRVTAWLGQGGAEAAVARGAAG